MPPALDLEPLTGWYGGVHIEEIALFTYFAVEVLPAGQCPLLFNQSAYMGLFTPPYIFHDTLFTTEPEKRILKPQRQERRSRPMSWAQ